MYLVAASPRCALRRKKSIPPPSFCPSGLEDFDQDQSYDKSPDMGEEGHVGDSPSHDPHELKEEPETQDDQGREADELNENDDEEQREHPGSGKKKEVST